MTKSVFSNEYRLFMKMLEQERIQANLTQVQLAKKLGKPQSYVSKYENGERRLDLIEFLQIASCLHINVPDFIERLTAPETN